ncbi:CAF17-like 4Fe-4S cluster assembly/insertion protein YgfZ [Undibacterium danionis]|uniref:YgfZ/GcvT domain-containing protein n=1 Tax=Undibacterium danionis TaxID=1812100 RepID=A0ABV6I9T9_9BURK
MNAPNSTQHFFELASSINTSNSTLAQLQDGYICHLQDQSLLQASGDDAASFLHNQLSNDVEHLNYTQARYAAYCTPKGRMLASFLYWKSDGNIILQCSSSLQPALQKRLQMFVMRSKVKLEDVSEQFATIGLGGKTASAFLLTQFTQLPEVINDKISGEAGTIIRVHDAFDTPRYLWILTHTKLIDISAQIDASLKKVDASIWRLGNIHAGVPQVLEQSKEKFVPQMINFELIGGVNFRKGCYPGQEIVARSQYLGKLKRRMAIARVSADSVDIATEVFSDNDPTQPCGMIVSAERDFDQNFACLVEMKLADQEQGKVHLGSHMGPILNFLPLPYAYLDVTE